MKTPEMEGGTEAEGGQGGAWQRGRPSPGGLRGPQGSPPANRRLSETDPHRTEASGAQTPRAPGPRPPGT